MQYNSVILTALAQLIELELELGLDTSTFTDQCYQILWLANSERSKHGIQPLKINNALNKLAAMKSEDMAEKDYFNHLSPTYGSAFDMLKANGINYSCAGENLAIDRNLDHAHTAWMNSKDHKKNILNPSFSEIGIGIFKKRNGSYTLTQLFIG